MSVSPPFRFVAAGALLVCAAGRTALAQDDVAKCDKHKCKRTLPLKHNEQSWSNSKWPTAASWLRSKQKRCEKRSTL